jgi:hypothetical protein
MRLAKIKKEFNAEEEIAKTFSAMEALKAEFIKSSACFVKSWYNTQYNKYIDMLAVRYEQLDDTQKNNLDADVDDMACNTKTAVKEYFSNSDLWWSPGQEPKGHDYYKSIDNLIDTDFRILLGGLGEVLNDYEFIPKYYDRPALGFVCKKDLQNVYRFIYFDPIFWSRDMKVHLDNYWENYKYIINLIDDDNRKKSA